MSVIDTYLQGIDQPQRLALERIRTIIREVVPDAEEVISYGMPGFTYRHTYLAGFNAFKDHLSFFPTSEPIETLKERLGDFVLSKGTIRFTADRPIPASIIKELLRVRVAAITRR